MKSVSTEILEKEEYDDKLSYFFFISAAIVQGKHERAFKFLSRNKERKGIELKIYINIFIIIYPLIYLVEIMMNKDPEVISSVLDFFSKKLDKSGDDYQRTKEVLQIERMKGEEKMMFYLVKCKEFDDKSLLEYIDSQNVRREKSW